eukprot:COSAG01_NODE_6913_length_3441_cov_8.635357_1_plen_69_part_00
MAETGRFEGGTLDHTVWVMVSMSAVTGHTNGCIGVVLHNKMVCIYTRYLLRYFVVVISQLYEQASMYM